MMFIMFIIFNYELVPNTNDEWNSISSNHCLSSWNVSIITVITFSPEGAHQIHENGSWISPVPQQLIQYLLRCNCCLVGFILYNCAILNWNPSKGQEIALKPQKSGYHKNWYSSWGSCVLIYLIKIFLLFFILFLQSDKFYHNASLLDSGNVQQTAAMLANATLHTEKYYGSDVKVAYRLTQSLLQHESNQQGFNLTATQDVHFTEVNRQILYIPTADHVTLHGTNQIDGCSFWSK